MSNRKQPQVQQSPAHDAQRAEVGSRKCERIQIKCGLNKTDKSTVYNIGGSWTECEALSGPRY
ncbi:hypothetical protein K435DRAFT_29885 [Dendrothele bispora CBS 962.96]|uniref:Uncharacterized protein n=1 Tax=Dendrothele bispora (strain CBS 962.96) TaxID=1314807 RepID=A0A4S8KU97_DENBC|nr:hypothetical protein K435DRAFT_29885 [Dendrothele bispora CBS 962.96]